MVRFVTKKESTQVGRCIYCDVALGELTEEHVSPDGLNGCITLLNASCRDCAKITSQIELHVLRHMWGAARAEMGYRSRDKKGPEALYPLTVICNGIKSVRQVPLRNAFKIIELPIFKAPSTLDGRALEDPIECISKDQFLLVERREDLAKRIGVDEVCPPTAIRKYSRDLLLSAPMAMRLSGMELRRLNPSMYAQQYLELRKILDDGSDRQTLVNSRSVKRQCRAASKSFPITMSWCASSFFRALMALNTSL